MNKNLFIVMGIFFVVLFNSIVYGALNADMFINGEAHVRVDKDIRITNLKVVEQTNGAYETYNSDYSKDSTSLQVTLPNSNSTMTYEVTILNKGVIDYYLADLLEESYSNSNIKYEVVDLKEGDIIEANSTCIFRIKLTTTMNNVSNQVILTLKYVFDERREWTFSFTGDVQEFDVPYSGIYKVELWGGKGGTVDSYIGGNGGYVSGELELSASKIYVVVGGQGPSNCSQNLQCNGGYNGGGVGKASYSSGSKAAGGAGATHIATLPGVLNTLADNKDSVLAVAAGGGGAHYTNNWNGGNGGVGGGESGKRPTTILSDTYNRRCPNPGTATGPGCSSISTDCGGFGKGGCEVGEDCSGGGAGYYGGSSGYAASGAGGSSYVHPSSTNVVNLSGDQSIPSYDGKSTMIGNSGNGYAKITLKQKNS